MLDVIMYGTTNKAVPETCSCGISEVQGEDASELEVFKDLEEFLVSTDIKDKINLKFTDIESVDKAEFPKLMEIVEKYGTPIISIGNEEFIVGNDHNVNVYIKIKNFLNKH